MALHRSFSPRQILQKLVELSWVRAQSLGLKLANRPTGDFNLEADDISVLDPTLGEGVLRPHELNHAGFYFLEDKKSAHRIVEDVPFGTS